MTLSMPLRARILRPTEGNLHRLASALRLGVLVAVPTETVYGLAADALNPAACAAIFTAKGRPHQDPLIVHVDSIEQAATLAELNDLALKLMQACWPGPLTLVLPKKALVPAIVTAGLPHVALRLPAHPHFRTLIRLSGRPLAAPSANPFGYISPTTAAHVRAQLGDRIRYILDGGPCAIGLESTILDLRDPAAPALLRPGAVPLELLADLCGRPIARRRPAACTGAAGIAAESARAPASAAGTTGAVAAAETPAAPANTSSTSPALTPQLAPGLLDRHYSPHTPITLVAHLPAPGELPADKTTACLYYQKPGGKLPRRVFWLTDTESPTQAAQNLFQQLRKLDSGRWSQLWIERAPGDSALAQAINDRLERAASRRNSGESSLPGNRRF